MEYFCKMIDFHANKLTQIIPQIMQLAQQIITSEQLPENVRCKAINIFNSICSSTKKLRNSLSGEIQQFMLTVLLPRLRLESSSYQEWM